MRAILLSLAAFVTIAATPVNAAATARVVGTVVHVSANNIKIREDRTGKVLSFLLVPRFRNVIGRNGQRIAQMSALRPGTPVTIIYDQKALGIRHADRILINGSARELRS
jgi:hypothetical protein